MTTQKLLYVFAHPPCSTATGQEAIDAALIGASFEQECSLLFVRDGVFQLKADQYAADSRLKPYTKAFKAMVDFGIEQVYVDELSMLARGLVTDDLMIEAVALNSDAVRRLIAEQFRVFTF